MFQIMYNNKDMVIKRFLLLVFLSSFFLVFSQSFANDENQVRILIFGDSITAGYGLDTEEAFPFLVGKMLNENGYKVEVVNAGLSGETSAGGVRRVDWVMRNPPNIFVLELGGNDGLRGIDPIVTKSNLQQIIDKVRAVSPDITILLAGMEAPPNMGEVYTNQFRNIFIELAEENEIPLMPFILEDVAGNPELNLPDGIHPTAKGHRIIAENLMPYLVKLLD